MSSRVCRSERRHEASLFSLLLFFKRVGLGEDGLEDREEECGLRKYVDV